MTQSKHTPGPWGMETLRTSCGVCHKIGPWPHKWRAGETMSACIYDDYPSPPEGTDTMLANALLIAAAPDMLAALQLGIEYDNLLLKFKGPRVLYDGDVAEVDAAYDRWVAAARAAYAKATS